MKEFVETALLGPLQALGKQVLALLPNVLAMVIILSVGLVTAWATGHLVERLLRAIGLDHLSNSLGVNAALARGGVKTDPSRIVGRAA
ncbi:MAG: mechanosensitive ion channel family protein, partial [Nitrospiraceae bacterium]